MNPHHLQFGSVDWSILGEQEGALTKVVGPTFDKGALSCCQVAKSQWRNFQGKRYNLRLMQLMLTENIELVGSSDVKAGLLGGGPKSKPRTYAAALLERSAAVTREKKLKMESQASDSPQSSAPTFDSFPTDDPEKEYMEMASNNHALLFANNGNQCSLTTMLHLMLSQPEIKEAILGTRIK